MTSPSASLIIAPPTPLRASAHQDVMLCDNLPAVWLLYRRVGHLSGSPRQLEQHINGAASHHSANAIKAARSLHTAAILAVFEQLGTPRGICFKDFQDAAAFGRALLARTVHEIEEGQHRQHVLHGQHLQIYTALQGLRQMADTADGSEGTHSPSACPSV